MQAELHAAESRMASEVKEAEDRMARESAWVLAVADMQLGADRAARASRMSEVESELRRAEMTVAHVEASTEAARAQLKARSARSSLASLAEDAEAVAAETVAGQLLNTAVAAGISVSQ